MLKLRVLAATLSALALIAAPATAIARPAAAAAVAGKAKPKKKVPLIRLKDGTTTITPDAAFVSALQGIGVTQTVLAPGATGTAGYAFPIVTGRLAGNKPAAGYVRHFGGLRLSGPTAHVDLNNLRINDGRTARVTAQLGAGARLAVARLDLTDATIRLTRRRFALRNLGLVLTDRAAAALNAALGTNAFTGGGKIGVASVEAKIRIVPKPLKRAGH